MDTLSPFFERTQEMIHDVLRGIPNLIIGLIIFWIFYVISKRVRASVAYVLLRSGRSPSASRVFGRLARWMTILAGLLVSLTIILPSFAPAQLIEILGIGSVAIGFAFRDILQNFLSGVLLLLTEPFHIGDQIVINEYEGVVEDIQIRATLIRTYDGKQVVIPNTIIFTGSVTVNTAYASRRSEYDVGIGYGDDIRLARRLIMEAIQSVEGVMAEPAPDVLAVELAPSWVSLRARWWTAPRIIDVLETQDQVIEAIKTRLYENGIDIPFPTQVLLFHDQTEATDGDRSRQREGWPAGPGPVPESARLSETLAEFPRLINKREDTS